MSTRVPLIVVASAVAVLLLVGCGLEGQPFSTATDKTDSTSEDKESVEAEEEPIGAEFNPTVVTADAIAQYPKNSPEAAALEWWRGVQTRDSDAVFESYTSEARDELPKMFPIALVSAISGPAANSSISVVDVESDDDGEATVYVVIDSDNPEMNGPLALPMEEVDDRWEIMDPVFLESLANKYIVASRLAEQAASDGGQ